VLIDYRVFTSTPRINVKLGGINTVPDAKSVPFLADRQNPAIIIGADVIHPSPGVDNKPSFTSMVANIDPMFSRYVAISKVQQSRQEIIADAEEMATVRTYLILSAYCLY
jgi:eukaryotic translation initiation factor 2C